MEYSSIPLAQNVVAHCEAFGIKRVVISPGSRNAPLTIGFTYHDNFKCYSIVDERCAAFFALGMAQQLKQPVALVCTSGSALLNYFPAVSEAYFSHVPLVVLSADRPEHLVGIGDGQTIFQSQVFGKHSFFSADLSSGASEEDMLMNSKLIESALSCAVAHQGPVHINVPFDEPLYTTTTNLNVPVPKRELPKKKSAVISNQIQQFQSIWSSTKRKMILVGVLYPNSIAHEIIETLANEESLIVFTETTSNLHHEQFFPSIDKIIAPLSEEDFKDLQPEFLLTFGGMVISKKVKAFLRAYPPKHHWHIGEHEANDTFFSLSEHVKVSPEEFFKAASIETSYVRSNYQARWLEVKAHRDTGHQTYVNAIPFSDLLVFHHLLNQLPLHYNIQMGNSSAIRYAQLFTWNKSIQMFCNRGTSGIDGSTSTAIGAAVIHDNPTLFITGDLSFFYDSNALWNNYIPNNFKIVLINNSGGGIFRILPGHKNTENFDRFFETKHNLTARQLCDMFGFSYLIATTESDFKQQFSQMLQKDDGPALLEVFTPSRINDEILLKYFEAVR